VLLVERVNEESLDNTVDTKQVKVVDVPVEAALRAAGAGRRDVIALGPFEQGKGDENLERIVEARLPVSGVAALDGGNLIEGGYACKELAISNLIAKGVYVHTEREHLDRNVLVEEDQ
jgi:hypothetical protein